MGSELVTGVFGAVFIGIGGTAVMDAWAILQKRIFGVPSLDYRLVGRWIGHFSSGRFRHDSIAKADEVQGEVVIGWAAHYLTGIAFAGLLLLIWPEWVRHPTLWPALLVGIGSIVAPFLVMQPCLGAGIAARRTPQPWRSRFRSLVAHTSFAIGLLVSGVLLAGWITGSVKHEIRAMKASGGGAIVNIGSNIGARIVRPGMGAYAVSKAAVSSLTRTTTLEAVEHGIRINCLCPGPTDTPLSMRPGEDRAARDARVAATNPSKRVAATDEIVAATLWLASDEAAYIVGQDIVIDGGASA